jgi:hypothetical protein
MATQTSCGREWQKKHTSNRDATFFTIMEILKADNIEESTTLEIEKTERLQTITERFSK